MRTFLLIGEESLRNACRDYFEARGCEVEGASEASEAAGLLRFRAYDLVVADLPSSDPARTEVERVVRDSRRAGARVLLTTADAQRAEHDEVVVLAKPQRLDALFALATAGATPARRSRSSRS